MGIMNWTWCSVTTKPHQSIQMVFITHMRMCNTSKRKHRPDRSHGLWGFCLPSSQRRKLKQVQDYLLERESSVASYHQDWAAGLESYHPSITDEVEAEAIVRESVGQIFARVLEDAGVSSEQQKAKQPLDALSRHF